jgi:hypothetical protein
MHLHRLMTLGSEVDDGEPIVSERHMLIDKDAGVVWAAMGRCSIHLCDESLIS